jgi:hypothetical protein
MPNTTGQLHFTIGSDMRIKKPELVINGQKCKVELSADTDLFQSGLP